MRHSLTALSLFVLIGVTARGEEKKTPAPEKGTIKFEPKGDQKNIPQQYRLDAHKFDYEMKYKKTLSDGNIDVFIVTFPSPQESPYPENNTVYAEYFKPVGKGPFPAVIILDVTEGDQALSRTMGGYLASKGIAGLFVQMAYYGPRRPPPSEGKIRMLSTNYPRSLLAVTQTVLDIRRATAWLESRPEHDTKRLGLVGTSLGSMVGALASEMEPKLQRVAVLLGGGGLVDGYYDHPLAEPYRKPFEKVGGTKDMVKKFIAPVDPLTCAENLKGRDLLIIGCKRDDIVPPKMTENLWKATGEQKIVWYDCTHYGAAVYLIPMIKQVEKHFLAP